jgi:hypothetical protein
MTTTTWNTAAPAIVTPEVPAAAKFGFKTFAHYVAVFFGATAETDSNFRGLDLNGNPVWIKS